MVKMQSLCFDISEGRQRLPNVKVIVNVYLMTSCCIGLISNTRRLGYPSFNVGYKTCQHLTCLPFVFIFGIDFVHALLLHWALTPTPTPTTRPAFQLNSHPSAYPVSGNNCPLNHMAHITPSVPRRDSSLLNHFVPL